jgi:hypothetical protein
VPPPSFLRVDDSLLSFHWYISTSLQRRMALAERPNTGSLRVSLVVASPVTWISFPSFAGSTAPGSTWTTPAFPSASPRAVCTARPSFQKSDTNEQINIIMPIGMATSAFPIREIQDSDETSLKLSIPGESSPPQSPPDITFFLRGSSPSTGRWESEASIARILRS